MRSIAALSGGTTYNESSVFSCNFTESDLRVVQPNTLSRLGAY